MIHADTITLHTAGFSEVRNLTSAVRRILGDSGLAEGVCNVFAIGSTASITTIEFEPALAADMTDALEKLWPRDLPTRHGDTWGDDNGFSHLRASFMGPNIVVPVHRGELVLGTWQQIVVIDHDNGPRERRVFVQIVGE
ncbi:YjbQ family protein [bacterium]|nr:MAG: YjbQ family protein [bacterium]